jgi:hypothetical protein
MLDSRVGKNVRLKMHCTASLQRLVAWRLKAGVT